MLEAPGAAAALAAAAAAVLRRLAEGAPAAASLSRFRPLDGTANDGTAL